MSDDILWEHPLYITANEGGYNILYISDNVCIILAKNLWEVWYVGAFVYIIWPSGMQIYLIVTTGIKRSDDCYWN